MADSTAPIALVTGAGSGLGAVIAERLAAEGLTVAVNTRSHTERADAVAAAIRAAGGCAFSVTANVTDPASVRHMFDAIAARGRLRVLVNNASYRPRQRVDTITEDDWYQVRAVTLDGAFRCVCPGGHNGVNDCEHKHRIEGSASFVPSVFGATAASITLKLLLDLPLPKSAESSPRPKRPSREPPPAPA